MIDILLLIRLHIKALLAKKKKCGPLEDDADTAGLHIWQTIDYNSDGSSCASHIHGPPWGDVAKRVIMEACPPSRILVPLHDVDGLSHDGMLGYKLLNKATGVMAWLLHKTQMTSIVSPR